MRGGQQTVAKSADRRSYGARGLIENRKLQIHKIKALYDEGRGSSLHAIAAQLGISRNTVRKYLALSAEGIAAYQRQRERTKRLDAHRNYIVHLLATYPRLTAVKVLRKLQEAHGDLGVSARSARRYISALKQTVSVKQERYYEPVLDLAPGVQCQVDGGELRGVMIGGLETTVYFVVFVLSYSRLMQVVASPRPVDTAALIRMHDAAFRAFGGYPKECVYDQTSLVVIAEIFRELTLNQRFHRSATTVGFRIRACEGYDPESKGKVEAGVKYVKQDGLYGETFADVPALAAHLARWLEETANVRTHAVTGEAPQVRYDRDERAVMGAYLSPPGIMELGQPAVQTRQADKTGLIAYRANKYSVPLAYQRAVVGVLEDDGQLVICVLDSGEVVARHPLAATPWPAAKVRCSRTPTTTATAPSRSPNWRRTSARSWATPWAPASAPCSRPPPQPSTRISCAAPRPYWPPSRRSAWT